MSGLSLFVMKKDTPKKKIIHARKDFYYVRNYFFGGVMSDHPKIKQCREAFIKLIHTNAYSHPVYVVFRDFCELAALSLSNSVDKSHYDIREAKYMEIIKSYTKEEINRFPEMFANVVMGLEAGFSDFMGASFMELDLGSHWHGQFFTPYPVASLMARLGLSNSIHDEIEKNGFISYCEPAVGAGVMVIAFIEALKEAGINYQKHLHVTAIDVDITAVHMAYIQLSLLGIPAIVVHGNSLTDEVFGCWYTPFHVLGFWNYRLKKSCAYDHVPEAMKPVTDEIVKEIDKKMQTDKAGQGFLF